MTMPFVVSSGVLKLYLRELPEPLMCSEHYNEWLQTLQKYVMIKCMKCRLFLVWIIHLLELTAGAGLLYFAISTVYTISVLLFM